MKVRAFVDRVKVHVKAGRGGDGSASFRREKFVPKGGPDGGDGGRGGHVILRGCANVNSLVAQYFAPRLFAENGVAGRGQKMYGRAGSDLIVRVPCGTTVYELEGDVPLADIVEDGQEAIIARGGKGGLGNVHFKTATHQAPTEFTPGEAGEEFRLRLELKTIADAGLLGFPNAGKSSLLASVSAARPKIANYPFTTLNPIVGTIHYPDFSQLRVADVPGIIEGASEGVGLGLEFLKHLARSRLLVYIIDMAGSDNRLPWDDYHALRSEVAQYDQELLERPTLVVANKMDLDAAIENLPRFVLETGITPLEMVACEPQHPGIAQFKQRLWDLFKPLPRGSWRTEGSQEASAATTPSAEIDPEAAILPASAIERAPFLDITPKKSKRKKRG